MRRPPVLLSAREWKKRSAGRSGVALVRHERVAGLAEVPAVADLAVGPHAVAGLLQQRGQCLRRLERRALPDVHSVVINARLPRAHAGEQSGPRWRADGRGGVGTLKDDAALSQALDVRRDDLPGVAIGIAEQPGVQIINHQEKDVGFVSLGPVRSDQRRGEKHRDSHDGEADRRKRHHRLVWVAVRDIENSPRRCLHIGLNS